MLKLVFLTDQFYNAYKNCPEIEQKETRPFIRIEIFLDGVLWAIPLRSNIAHQHVIWTDRENGCGADLTKAVVIEDPEKYISDIKPYVRPNEFKVLKKLTLIMFQLECALLFLITRRQRLSLSFQGINSC